LGFDSNNRKNILVKYIKVIVFASLLGLGSNFCNKKYLDKRPLGLDETELTNKKGVEGLLIGAYSLLDGIGSVKSGFGSAGSNWIYGSICGSEAYKGSVDFDQALIAPIETFSATATNEFIAMKWATVYDGVQRANEVLRITKKAKDISAVDQKRIEGEARFLRAHYHFEAKKMWNKVPFIDEAVTYENGNYHVSNEKDIWPDIENDLKYSVDNLAPTSFQGAIGRANKYTATALLAKVYMFQKKFDDARPLLQTIIHSGNYQLVNYHDNFNADTKNRKEAIFSAQSSVNDGSMGLNGNYGDYLNFPFGWLVGQQPGLCCGFFQPSQYLVNHFKTDSLTGLPDPDHFNEIDVKNDSGLSSNEPFIPYAGTLDSRLDWTIGRRGIPYLDWGPHPGKDWIRDQQYGGPYTPKKNSYYKSQETRLTDASFWSTGTTANNINLIRYADVLLWAAEVEIEVGSFDKAREYINEVRTRAANSSGWVKKPDGTPAANYKVGIYTTTWINKTEAMKALQHERMLELAMEGHRFFDLVRWGIADSKINKYLEKEKKSRTHLNDAVFLKDCNEYFPIPQTQIDLSAGTDGKAKMTQNCF
jgi:starch-binding outer membrane protein, SusD/RagB family